MPEWIELPSGELTSTPSPTLLDSLRKAAGKQADALAPLAARVIPGDERVVVAFSALRVGFYKDGSHEWSSEGGGKNHPNTQVLLTPERLVLAYFVRGMWRDADGRYRYVEYPLSSISEVTPVHMGKFALKLQDGTILTFVFLAWALSLRSIRSNREACSRLVSQQA